MYWCCWPIMDSRANNDILRMNNNKTTINKSLTMKKLAFFLVMLAAVAVGQAQTTGTGVVLQTASPYEFTPDDSGFDNNL